MKEIRIITEIDHVQVQSGMLTDCVSKILGHDSSKKLNMEIYFSYKLKLFIHYEHIQSVNN